MKLKDIQVGGRYYAKVSGVVQVVRVTEITEVPPASWSRTDRWRTSIRAINEATGRKIYLRSAARLRGIAQELARISAVRQSDNLEGETER